MEYNNHEYTICPYGYLVRSSEGVKDYEDCTYIDELFNLYTGISNSVDLFKLREDVFRYALDKFTPEGGFINWLITNLEHAKLNKYTHMFLLDTYKFITTGKRDIDIITWPYTLKLSKEYDQSKPTESNIKLLPVTSGNIDNSLALWISHDNGFVDMLWTLKLLFGTTEQE